MKQQPDTAEFNFEYALKEEAMLRTLQIGDPYRYVAQSNIDFFLDRAARQERGHEVQTA